VSARDALLALATALAATAPAHAQEVELANAWMRPAYAGQPQAAVYVDIRAKRPLRLVGASTVIAKRAALVLVDPPDPDPAAHRVVAELPVAADRETRLALGSSHIRLVDVVRDLQPGEQIALELAFVDAAGKRQSIATSVLVRGLMIHRPEAAPAGAPAR
jgi:copper(I)-binding protein